MSKADDPTAIQVAGQSVSRHVFSNIQKASSDSGVSFSFLMAQAGKESAFKSNAGSRASSAAGLFQFTRSTWLGLMKRHGADHGLEDLANSIKRGAKGEYLVDDAQTRQKILDLRRDPALSAQFAAEYAKENKSTLEHSLGRAVNSAELYMAHFLGPGGATRVLKARDSDPAQPAAAILPQAASKNPSVFYDQERTPRSVAQVYDRISHAIEKPMKQYASLDSNGEKTVGAATHRRSTKVATTQQPDPQWPFETGKWPPSPPPPAIAAKAETSAVGTATGTASSDWTSADRVVRPMPARPSEGGEKTSALDKILGSVKKGLFG